MNKIISSFFVEGGVKTQIYNPDLRLMKFMEEILLHGKPVIYLGKGVYEWTHKDINFTKEDFQNLADKVFDY